MKFHSLTRYLVAIASVLFLASCGGGGGATAPQTGGPVVVQPDGSTLFAGVVNTITVQGGRTPYTLTSTEPGLLPLPATLDGHSIDVVPNNPSVIDQGLAPEDLPVRTVIITARSADGTSGSATVKIARNFLTGYGIAFGATTCTALAAPCAGGDTAILFDSTSNGNLRPNRTYRLERVQGPFTFIDPLGSGNTNETVNVTSDSNGRFTVIVRIQGGVRTQIAVMRVTDVATGSTTLQTFVINGATGAMTLIPASANLTGPNGNVCGFGNFDVLVFDGQGPYTAICPNPQIAVSPPTSNTTPGRFTVTVGASNICLTNEQCVFQDSSGARAIFNITTTKGTSTPPPALAVTPNTITLTCGASGNVTVTGGGGSYQANSTHPRVTAVVSGNTVTITRLGGPDPAGGPFPGTATISITDGATAVPVTATVPPAC